MKSPNPDAPRLIGISPAARPATRVDVGTRWPKFAAPLALLAGSLVFAALSTRELWDDGMLAFGDLTRIPSDSSVFLESFRDAWSDRGLGGVFPASALSLLPAFLLVLTSGNETLVQQLHMTLWIPVAFCGMAYVCRRFIHTSWWLAALGGVLYVATPVSIGLFVAGAGGLVWAYGLAPLAFAGAELLQRRGFAGVAAFAAAVALVAVPSVELLAFGVLTLLVWLIVGRERHELALAGAFAVGLAVVTALPSLLGRSGVRLGPELIERTAADFEYTYERIAPQLLARLAGNQGDPMDPLGYNGWETWTYAGYLPIAALVLGLVFRRRGDMFPIKTTLLGITAGALLIAIAAIAEAKPSLFADVQPLVVFRNPEKLMIVLAAALIPGAVYGVHRLFEVFPQHRNAIGVGVVASLIAYLGVYASPALSGHWGVATVRDSYTADETVRAASQYLLRTEPSLPGRWRVIWLPFGHDEVLNLEWILPQWANEPDLERRDREVADTTRLLLDALQGGDVRRFHAIADRASVRYVVVRSPGDRNVARMLASDPASRLINQGEGFVVWRNTAALPRIRPFSELKGVVAPQRGQPVRYTSAPILTLSPNALAANSGWTTHRREDFERVGPAIRIRGVSSRFWPELSTRIRVDGEASYVLSGWARTRNAGAAHLKVIWYRTSGAPEIRALRHDYARPRLSGNNGWTRLSAVVTSPAGAKFAQIAFLGGKPREGSGKAALTWVRDIRFVNRYVGDLPVPTGAVADVLPDLTRRGQEFAAAGSIASMLEGRDSIGVPLTAVVVNPSAGGPPPAEVQALLQRGARMQVAATALVAFQPRAGAWGRSKYAVEVASERARGAIPLGAVAPGRYVLSMSGCRLGSGSVRIQLPRRTLEPRFSGPGSGGCGRWQTAEPVALAGRTVVLFTLARDASIVGVQASPAVRRQEGAQTGPLTIADADKPSPRVSGLTSPGLTLADAYHRGWETSGSGGGQFRTFLGFNGFLVDKPTSLSGLSYGPQLTRDLFLVVSAIGWLAILGVWLYYRRRNRPRAYPNE